MLLAWNGFLFEMGGVAFDRLRRLSEARWRDHEIIGRAPAGQYLGPGRERITLTGVIFTAEDGASAEAQVAAMRAACRAGQVGCLVSGVGSVSGPFRLERVERDETYHDDAGAPGRIGWTLEFAAQEDGNGQVWSVWP